MEQQLDQAYWNQRYLNTSTGWDIGYASAPITTFVDTLTQKDISILIPGCGNAYEAAYLVEKGFTNITLLDIAPTLVAKLNDHFNNISAVHVLQGDFFEHDKTYDLILEQTFFCALPPSLRPSYVRKMHSLIRENGILAGVLFNKEFETDGPPFGGSYDEYKWHFDQFFHIQKMEPCTCSIPQRAGSELWIELCKKSNKG